ncbi:hypothetical protein DFS34DRAFT_427647 [Phlyctochytrium arcticum]|nr:hypothetical protein DFS34DRAFT_427647 [Phlyctochytrium arcticum]
MAGRRSLPMLFLLAAGLLPAYVAGQGPTTLGGSCVPSVDVFGCQGVNYMSCDPQSNRWILQNLCPADCLTIPSFAANCGRNSNGITPSPTPGASPTATVVPPGPTPTSSTGTGTPSPSTNPSNSLPSIFPSNSSDASSSPSSSSSKILAAIIVPIVVAVALMVAVFAFCLYRRRKHSELHGPNYSAAGKHRDEGLNRMEAGGSAVTLGGAALNSGKPAGGLPAHLNVASVLEKRYVVAHDYQPAADDEVNLRVGDIIHLSLLFNDGWAKGTNESTGEHGLLPCACIHEMPATPT